MALPFRPLEHPLTQTINLRRAQPLLEFRRRHHFVGFAGRHSTDQLTFFKLRGNDHRDTFSHPERVVFSIEAQVRLPRLLVRPVARIAMLREDRANLPVEIDRLASANLIPCRRTDDADAADQDFPDIIASFAKGRHLRSASVSPSATPGIRLAPIISPHRGPQYARHQVFNEHGFDQTAGAAYDELRRQLG